ADLNLTLTATQKQFMDAEADEVLFGGAAGGGKSYGQLADALVYALRYPGSRQLILRRTFPELEHSIIFTSLQFFPPKAAKYRAANHTWEFCNKSLIEFGYLAAEKDVLRYQGAEYDVVRFDELTHFTEEQYTYLLSRIRGVNSYPKQMKSSTNPGGIGHAWVKRRFIDGAEPGELHRDAATGMSRIFIPSFVQDNVFLMRADKDYQKRLELLPEAEKKALLYGQWDIFDGQVFAEWRNDPRGYKTRRWSHVIAPFAIPKHWRRFRTFDFGYSKPFAVSWFAVDEDGRAYNYRELYGCTGTPDTGIRWTAQRIAKAIREIEEREEQGQTICGYADPAIWNATGSAEGSIAEMMERAGVYFEKGKNNRLAGKMQVHYRLAFDEEGIPMLYVFDTCKHMIRTLPQLRYDSVNPEDVDTRQEDHLYDAMKYFLMSDPIGPREAPKSATVEYNPLAEDTLRDYERFVLP
ncbi:MAG: phage terminase large subunit, partial [Clostridia bacterium]|nr:phage terminase large subunit [Clostridia bacterium]